LIKLFFQSLKMLQTFEW